MDRLRALKQLGLDVIPFDLTKYTRTGPRLLRTITWRFYTGPSVSKLNRDLRLFGSKNIGYNLVWVDKGVWIWNSTLKFLKEQAGARAVHFTPDPAILFHRSPHFLSSIPDYDFHFTSKQYELDLYRERGAQRVFMIQKCTDESRFYPRPPDPSLACEVLFIGRREPHYERTLESIAKLGVDLKIWGPGWSSKWFRPGWQRKSVAGSGLWGDSYPRALSSTCIAIGLLSKLIPDSVTSRSMEIPACGAFFLAERTSDHQSLYKEGVEAEYFGSTEELTRKVRYFLEHPDERKRIAEAGYRRYRMSNSSMIESMKKVMKIIGSNAGELPQEYIATGAPTNDRANAQHQK